MQEFNIIQDLKNHLETKELELRNELVLKEISDFDHRIYEKLAYRKNEIENFQLHYENFRIAHENYDLSLKKNTIENFKKNADDIKLEIDKISIDMFIK
jgi:hypothetical protein